MNFWRVPTIWTDTGPDNQEYWPFGIGLDLYTYTYEHAVEGAYRCTGVGHEHGFSNGGGSGQGIWA
jgi:hypothetical protein